MTVIARKNDEGIRDEPENAHVYFPFVCFLISLLKQNRQLLQLQNSCQKCLSALVGFPNFGIQSVVWYFS
jgi:hypothetical protein